MPRTGSEDTPQEVKTVVAALMMLARREGISRTKLATAAPLLKIAARQHPEADLAKQVELAERLIRLSVDTVPRRRDRGLLVAGLNLEASNESSVEARILTEVDTFGSDVGELEPDSAMGRFRYELLRELAWRLLTGGPPTPVPIPPADDFALAQRLVDQQRFDSAEATLQRIVQQATDDATRRNAWRMMATLAVGQGDYDKAEAAFEQGLAVSQELRKGGKLTVAIDRYAVRLIHEEEYDRASRMVERALRQFFVSGWLWRRYGVVKWYAGDLVAAYAAMTTALQVGYPRSRVLHARGQVLAELGRYQEAIEELDEALRYPRSVLSAALARSARSFALGMSGDLEGALEGFHEAEIVISDSAWLRYYRGRCLLVNGNMEAAQGQLRAALVPSASNLNLVKREHAMLLLAQLDAEDGGSA